MQVRVRLFAGLRERAGRELVELDLPEGASVGDALGQLDRLTSGVPVLMAVNRRYAEAEDRLQPGDELALIPPVSGGAGPRVQEGSSNQVPAGEISPPHVRITGDPLSLDGLLGRVRDARAGAIVSFLGVTRQVGELQYEAYAEMAEKEMRKILTQAIERHGLCAAAAEHRVGAVPLSEPSVTVAASAPHREAAFAGAREIIDEIKARAPIWKKEQGEWVQGAIPAPRP